MMLLALYVPEKKMMRYFEYHTRVLQKWPKMALAEIVHVYEYADTWPILEFYVTKSMQECQYGPLMYWSRMPK